MIFSGNNFIFFTDHHCAVFFLERVEAKKRKNHSCYLQFMSTSTVVLTGLVRLVLVASQVNLVLRKLRSTSWNVISFLTVPLLKIWYVSSINRPDFDQVTRGSGFPEEGSTKKGNRKKAYYWLYFFYYLHWSWK